MLDADAKLCALEDIADNDALGMVARIEGKQRNIFVARRGDAEKQISTSEFGDRVVSALADLPSAC